jgi:hypothetical protein
LGDRRGDGQQDDSDETHAGKLAENGAGVERLA